MLGYRKRMLGIPINFGQIFLFLNENSKFKAIVHQIIFCCIWLPLYVHSENQEYWGKNRTLPQSKNLSILSFLFPPLFLSLSLSHTHTLHIYLSSPARTKYTRPPRRFLSVICIFNYFNTFHF